MIRKLAFVSAVLLTTACSPASSPKPEIEAQEPLGNQAKKLYVAAEYNDTELRLHYRLEVENPSWYHQYWVFRDGQWHREGSGSEGPDANGLYEDRISMLLDDGSVQGFDRFGGFMLAHPGMRSMDTAASEDEVSAHPVLGEKMGRSDVRKYLPQSRDIEYYSDPAPWHAIKSQDALSQMQQTGEFLDLWQWRAHRSNPLGYADNGYVLHYRLNSEGRSMFTSNQADDDTRPAYMFDAEKTGQHALNWDALTQQAYSQDDFYYLSEDHAKPFDEEHPWQDGDVLPYRLLQTPDGARGAIKAQGRYEDGAWRVTLTRSLASPNTIDSKALQHGERYHVAFAVHHGGVGARYHRVSLPHSLGLGVDADIVATQAQQALAEDELNWHEVGLVDPHQVNWEWLVTRHQGANFIRGDMPVGVRDQHGHLPAFQRYLDRHERMRQQQQEHLQR